MHVNDLNCFSDPDIVAKAVKEGALSGLTFAAKDLFDVAGHASGCGNPTWATTHLPAKATASLILDMLQSGATLKGKTHMNELAFGLDGENIHYGMPLNPQYPDRIPGGSSGGSASAAAACVVDFSLGTDTGGSVRVPASCCGILGIRPTHGLLSLDGVMPLSQSFDVAGWFSADDKMFQILADTFFPVDAFCFDTVILVDDVYSMTPRDLRGDFDRVFMTAAAMLDKNARVVLSESGLDSWRDAFRVVQGFEVWKNHGDWFSSHNPKMSKEIAARMKWSATVDESVYTQHLKRKGVLGEMGADILADNAVFILPTIPGPVPLRSQSHEELEEFRMRTFKATCIAGILGMPQVTIPSQSANGPFGVSFIGPRNSDRSLVELALTVHRKLISSPSLPA